LRNLANKQTDKRWLKHYFLRRR